MGDEKYYTSYYTFVVSIIRAILGFGEQYFLVLLEILAIFAIFLMDFAIFMDFATHVFFKVVYLKKYFTGSTVLREIETPRDRGAPQRPPEGDLRTSPDRTGP